MYSGLLNSRQLIITMSKRSASSNEQVQANAKKTKTSLKDGDNTSEMAASQTTKRILVVGLSGHAAGQQRLKMGAQQPRGQFRKMLQDTISKAKSSGLELDVMQVKASAFPSGLKDIEERLQSKPDGVVIGNGIRGTSEYTVFFEDVVNACREISPGSRLGFNTSPDDILACCLRNFG